MFVYFVSFDNLSFYILWSQFYHYNTPNPETNERFDVSPSKTATSRYLGMPSLSTTTLVAL